MVEYNQNQVGYTCAECGANFLTRRLWRWHFCIDCWRRRLPVSIAMITIGVVIGLLLSLGVGKMIGMW